ncbi:MAG: hypothetical protein ACREUT_17585 [Steroidobacteraceae bacterium]
MHRAMTPAILALLAASAATCLNAAQLPAKSPGPMTQASVLREVHLNGPADLEHLRETNFYHYLRAKKILAAANEICAPKPARTYLARFKAADPQCGFMWMTSLPPKRELRFRLDDVYYVALVTVTNLRAKAISIGDSKRSK